MPQSLHRDSVVKLEESFTQPSDRRTLTDIEVAARLGVSRFTVRSWRLKGVGPRFMKMGRAVRYRPQDVDEYERQALVETQASAGSQPDVISSLRGDPTCTPASIHSDRTFSTGDDSWDSGNAAAGTGHRRL